MGALMTDHSEYKPSETRGWEKTENGLAIMWKKITTIPDACIQLITCGCKINCKTANCKCVKQMQPCIPARGCYAVDCCNPSGHHDDEYEDPAIYIIHGIHCLK